MYTHKFHITITATCSIYQYFFSKSATVKSIINSSEMSLQILCCLGKNKWMNGLWELMVGYWQGITEAVRGKPVPISLSPPHLPLSCSGIEPRPPPREFSHHRHEPQHSLRFGGNAWLEQWLLFYLRKYIYNCSFFSVLIILHVYYILIQIFSKVILGCHWSHGVEREQLLQIWIICDVTLCQLVYSCLFLQSKAVKDEYLMCFVHTMEAVCFSETLVNSC